MCNANFDVDPEMSLFGEFDGDVSMRMHETLPSCDVYFAGFPCQGISKEGLQEGFDDPRTRVFHDCVETIRATVPRVAILENVAALLDKGKNEETWRVVENSLQEVARDLGYTFLYATMDAKDHGLPMHRNRVWMLLLKSEFYDGSFEWPRNLPQRPLEPLLDGEPLSLAKLECKRPKGGLNTSLQKAFDAIQRGGGRSPLQRLVLVKLGTRGNDYQEDACPTLLHHVKPIWISNRGRTLNLEEQMRLMGLKLDDLQMAVSQPNFLAQLGNSMAVNVLERLLCRVLPSVRLTGPLTDRWADGSAYAALSATSSRSP